MDSWMLRAVAGMCVLAVGCNDSFEGGSSVSFKGVWQEDNYQPDLAQEFPATVDSHDSRRITVFAGGDLFRIREQDADPNAQVRTYLYDGQKLASQHGVGPDANVHSLEDSYGRLESLRFWDRDLGEYQKVGPGEPIAGRKTTKYTRTEEGPGRRVEHTLWVDQDMGIHLKEVVKTFNSDGTLHRTRIEECLEIEYGPVDPKVFKQF